MRKITLSGAVILLFLAACSPTGTPVDKATDTDASSRACKGAGSYLANGRRFQALSHARGYRAEGMAHIYQGKASGSQTAGCETFDINGFTAAHRTLPLPTYIKITNKNNNQSVVVKVNDRGPASGNGLLLVTPATASILGANGAFPVRIEVVATQKAAVAAAKPSAVQQPGARRLSVNRKPVRPANADRYYIIVGTYTSSDDAFDRFVRVSSIGLAKATMETRQVKGRTLHMVRLGPYYEQDEIDHARDKLKNDGLVNFKIVKN